MARTTTQMDDDGRIITHKATRAQRKSEQRLIGWTPGPQTLMQRIKRAAIG